MGETREFIVSSLVDALLPWIRRPLEDVVYEVIDSRRVPSRTELRVLEQRLDETRQELRELRRMVEALREEEPAKGPRHTP